MEAFVSAGGYEMEARAKAILLGLGFSVAQLDAPVATLSGGWARKPPARTARLTGGSRGSLNNQELGGHGRGRDQSAFNLHREE
jgi:hypothetical protein